jgi:hypothetical protein
MTATLIERSRDIRVSNEVNGHFLQSKGATETDGGLRTRGRMTPCESVIKRESNNH